MRGRGWICQQICAGAPGFPVWSRRPAAHIQQAADLDFQSPKPYFWWVSTDITFGNPEAFLKRKAEERRKFLELPPAEAQRLIDVPSYGPPLNAHDEDPLFTTDLTNDGVVD